MSSETQQQQKRKRVVSKAYSGLACRTCSIRELKCDEGRPVCKQCLVAKRTCRFDAFQIHFEATRNALAASATGGTQPGGKARVPFDKQPSEVRHIVASDSSVASQWPAVGPRARLPIDIYSYGHMQLQLRNNFIEDCRPNANRTEGCFTGVLIVTDLSPRSLNHSASALALVHAACRQQPANYRLIYKAAELYGNALTNLRQALAPAVLRKRKDDYSAFTMLLSMMLIAIYAEPRNIRPQGHEVEMKGCWEQHIYAAARYIKAVGPQAFDLSSEMEGQTVHSAMYMSFKTSLCLRRAMVLEQDVARFLTPDLAKATGMTTEFFQWHRTSFRLPGLLERTDLLIRASGKSADAVCDDLVWSLVQVRQDLRLFSQTFLDPIIVLAVPEDLDTSDLEHRFLENTSLFRSQYRFPNLLIGTACIVTWLPCLLADCAALQLIHHGMKSRHGYEDPASELERSAFDSAVQLCQTAHFLCRRENIIYAHTMKMVLKVAGSFFDELGARGEFEWCQECQTACRERFERLEQRQPVTLCRVGSVMDALVTAVKYCSPSALFTKDTAFKDR